MRVRDWGWEQIGMIPYAFHGPSSVAGEVVELWTSAARFCALNIFLMRLRVGHVVRRVVSEPMRTDTLRLRSGVLAVYAGGHASPGDVDSVLALHHRSLFECLVFRLSEQRAPVCLPSGKT